MQVMRMTGKLASSTTHMKITKITAWHYTEIPQYQLNKLQRVQNLAARVVSGCDNASSTVLLKQLHWLPVQARIMFKVLVMVFRTINGTAPIYLKKLLVNKRSRPELRSCSGTCFTIPRRRTKVADKSFSVVGPKWWNNLPTKLRHIDSEAKFKAELKTHLFNVFYWLKYCEYF